MNVCILCGGDGVLLTSNHWYCINHVDDGFIATAVMVARLKGGDETEAEAKAIDWIQELR
jgi:hypothetical protein